MALNGLRHRSGEARRAPLLLTGWQWRCPSLAAYLCLTCVRTAFAGEPVCTDIVRRRNEPIYFGSISIPNKSGRDLLSGWKAAEILSLPPPGEFRQLGIETHAAAFRLLISVEAGLEYCRVLGCRSSPSRKLISPPSRMAKPDK
jgi:hypothetical protein